MRKLMLALGLAATVLPSIALPVSAAQAQRYRDRDRYEDRRYSNNDQSQYREYRDNRGRLRCRKPDGTTGLVVGGVAGALLGRTVDTRGDRTLGTLGGAAAGALAGRAIDRGSSNDRHCR